AGDCQLSQIARDGGRVLVLHDFPDLFRALDPAARKRQGVWAAITERRLDVDEPLRKWLEGPPPPRIPARPPHGAPGAAVTAPSSDGVGPRALPLELPVLARDLDGGLVGVGPAQREKRPGQPTGRERGDLPGRLDHGKRNRPSRRIGGDRAELFNDPLDDLAVRVAERHRALAAHAVEVAPTLDVVDVVALRPGDERILDEPVPTTPETQPDVLSCQVSQRVRGTSLQGIAPVCDDWVTGPYAVGWSPSRGGRTSFQKGRGAIPLTHGLAAL